MADNDLDSFFGLDNQEGFSLSDLSLLEKGGGIDTNFGNIFSGLSNAGQDIISTIDATPGQPDGPGIGSILVDFLKDNVATVGILGLGTVLAIMGFTDRGGGKLQG